MWEKNQKTISKSTTFSGIGLHSGERVKLKLEQAQADSGIVFVRTDLKKNNIIEANFKNVSSAVLCTKITNDYGVSISTIEHLMAAFYFCGIDNLIVKIDGPEVPIMDGSAKEFVEKINLSGTKILDKTRKLIKVTSKFEFAMKDKSIRIEPSNNNFTVKFILDYDNPLINTQTNFVNFRDKNLEDVYTARTFCLFEDIEKVKSLGLGKGGSLENAIVVKGNEVLNDEGLRCKNEFVNHKILDLAGDFMLAGFRVLGSVKCTHGGHSLTNNFLRKFLSDTNNFTIVENSNNVTNIKKITSLQKRIAVNA